MDDWMIYVAALILIGAVAYAFHRVQHAAFRSGYDRGYSDADFQAEDTDRRIQSLRLEVSVQAAEIERLRDELLRRDAHTFVNSI